MHAVPVIFEKKRSSLCILKSTFIKLSMSEKQKVICFSFSPIAHLRRSFCIRDEIEQLVQGKCGKTHIQKLVSAVFVQVAAQVSPFPCSLEKLRVDDRLILLSCTMSQDAGHGQFTVQHAGSESIACLLTSSALNTYIFFMYIGLCFTVTDCIASCDNKCTTFS